MNTNERRMAARGVSHPWEKRNSRARTWSAYVKAFRLAMRRAIIRRSYTARRVRGGSVTLTLKMSSGIRVCCRLVKRVARRRSHPHLRGVTTIDVAPMVREPWLMCLAEEYSCNQFLGARPNVKGELQ